MGNRNLKRKKEILGIIPAVLGILTGFLFHADYNWKGIVLILVLYVFYFYPVEKPLRDVWRYIGRQQRVWLLFR